MQNLVVLLESIGMFAVCLCFVILMPSVANILLALVSMMFGEQTLAKIKKERSGTDMGFDDSSP